MNTKLALLYLLTPIISACTTVGGPSETAGMASQSAVTAPTPITSTEGSEYPLLESQRNKAQSGNAEEQFILAGMYERGQGAPQSYDEGAKWYRAAADQGHAAAQFYLGAMYGSERGVARSYEAAVWWYMKSAAQGYKDAFFPMAYASEYGIGILAKDHKAAVEWYQKSADAGVWQAYERLGRAYQYGELGLKPDPAKGREYSEKAVALGRR